MADLRIDTARLQTVVMSRAEVFIKSFVRQVAGEAKRLAPERSGELKRLIREDEVRRTGPWSLSSGVSGLANYSAPVHEGARPHVIRPRNARALRFEVEGGRIVFARRVNHPGNAANPFLRNAAHRVASADPRISLGER